MGRIVRHTDRINSRDFTSVEQGAIDPLDDYMVSLDAPPIRGVRLSRDGRGYFPLRIVWTQDGAVDVSDNVGNGLDVPPALTSAILAGIPDALPTDVAPPIARMVDYTTRTVWTWFYTA